jgi:RNA polymerase sigma-54 factor
MAIELKQSIKLTQQLVMTPQLQQAIRLLQLSRLELTDAINQEMLENPILEELNETELEPEQVTRHTDEAEGVKPQETEDSYETLDWNKFLDEFEDFQYTSGGSGGGNADRDELPSIDATMSQPVTLADHLLWQLKLSNLTFEEEKIGRLIIGNLNDDGYLTTDVELIAQESGVERERVEAALRKVQLLDPIGVGARDLTECLLLQARQFGHEPLVEAIVQGHLHQLETKDYRAIARSLKAPLPRVREAVKLIQSLEPKPGRPFFTDRTDYITPDIFVYKVGDDFTIVLNEDGLPKLRVSPYYRRLLKDKGKDSELTREYIQDKLRSAVWLIRSLHQRQRTIYRVMESILKHQREFFERGITQLRPMVLRDVASDIAMHESTVSRVTTNKYVYTPQGIFPMKFFFNSKIGTLEGGEVAAETVKDRIRQMLVAEDPKKPMSDQEIVNRVREYGIDIARRTVTKYREMMGILSSTKRKRTI